jgi:hypothetical protein
MDDSQRNHPCHLGATTDENVKFRVPPSGGWKHPNKLKLVL